MSVVTAASLPEVLLPSNLVVVRGVVRHRPGTLIAGVVRVRASAHRAGGLPLSLLRVLAVPVVRDLPQLHPVLAHVVHSGGVHWKRRVISCGSGSG